MDVAVVIPCYNQARFLADAIESARRQSLLPVEIIVVDDGSTDDVGAVCSEFAEVRCIRQSNRGLSSARNAGCATAKAPYVVFLDADDRLRPDALAHGAAMLDANPNVAFVSGEHCYIDESGVTISEWSRPAITAEHYKTLLESNYIGMGATVMFRRAILDSVGGFDSSLPACEDYDVYLRISRVHGVAAHSHTIAEYRRHPGGMSQDPLRMLTGALGALAKQRVWVRRDPALLAAYRAGQMYWWKYYGPAVGQRARAELRGGHFLGAARSVRLLARGLALRITATAREIVTPNAGNGRP